MQTHHSDKNGVCKCKLQPLSRLQPSSKSLSCHANPSSTIGTQSSCLHPPSTGPLASKTELRPSILTQGTGTAKDKNTCSILSKKGKQSLWEFVKFPRNQNAKVLAPSWRENVLDESNRWMAASRVSCFLLVPPICTGIYKPLLGCWSARKTLRGIRGI